MEKSLQQFFVSHNLTPHRNQGILIIPVKDQISGISIVKEILYELVNKKNRLIFIGRKNTKRTSQTNR